ncbi:hypothetical protein [Pseudogemmobacter bohemicus]|uniref:hypothetical protein n=1 Tax=Pseudogemmobacter bohemicus TaxID=2250708 RepID=UPI001300BAA3|nr:hypothetical protein [Pseudogemmobacter bohemicus]
MIRIENSATGTRASAVAFRNVLAEGVLSWSSETPDGFAENALGPQTFDYWTPAAMPATLAVLLTEAVDCDCAAIIAHTLGSASATVHVEGSLTFVLSGLDTEGANVLPPGSGRRVPLTADASIPAGFDLWQNTAGQNGTHYVVLARWTEPDRGNGQAEKYATLGKIQLGSDPSYALAELLIAGAAPAGETFWSSLTQAQYEEMAGAVAEVELLRDEVDATAAAAELARIAAVAAASSTPFNTPLAFGGDPSGLADSRTAFLLANDVNEIFVPTGTYRIASNMTITRPVQFADGAKLVVPSGVTVHLARGYVADPYNHCFDISGGGTVTVGAAPMGYVTPQHWGARGIGAGHDDWPAITAASRAATLNTIREEYAESVPVRFPSVPAYYRVAQTWFVTRTALFYGDTPAPLRGQKGVEIRGVNGIAAVMAVLYPGGVSGVGVYKPENAPDHPTVPGFGLKFGGLRSRFRNLNFLPEAGATVRQGVVHNATAFFEYCLSSGFSEADWHAHAQTSGLAVNLFDHPGRSNANNTTPGGAAVIDYSGTGSVYGNVNGSIYHYCMGQGGLMHGAVCHGNNAGTVTYFKSDCAGNMGAGFLDNTTIGSEYIACHSAQNTFKVLHNGVYYMCIKGHTSASDSEPGVGANWRTYWATITATVKDGDWVTATLYWPSGGIHVCSPNGRASIIGCYSEGGIEKGIVARNTTTVVGGTSAERVFWHPEYAGAKVVGPGIQNSPAQYQGQTSPDDSTTAFGGGFGQVNGFTGGRIAQYGDGRDDAVNTTSALRLSWNQTRGRYEWTDAKNSSRGVWGVSGAGFGGTGYGAITQRFLWVNGVYIADGSATGNAVNRVRSCTNLAAITDANFGAAVRGDRWLYTQPSAGGYTGAVCTTAGTLGSTAVIKQFGQPLSDRGAGIPPDHLGDARSRRRSILGGRTLRPG